MGTIFYLEFSELVIYATRIVIFAPSLHQSRNEQNDVVTAMIRSFLNTLHIRFWEEWHRSRETYWHIVYVQWTFIVSP
jgi:hypothetical protein